MIFVKLLENFPMIKILNKLKCWWYGHDWDKETYRKELQEHYRIDKNKFGITTRKVIEDYFNNPPKPNCKRCNKKL